MADEKTDEEKAKEVHAAVEEMNKRQEELRRLAENNTTAKDN